MAEKDCGEIGLTEKSKPTVREGVENDKSEVMEELQGDETLRLLAWTLSIGLGVLFYVRREL